MEGSGGDVGILLDAYGVPRSTGYYNATTQPGSAGCWKKGCQLLWCDRCQHTVASQNFTYRLKSNSSVYRFVQGVGINQ